MRLGTAIEHLVEAYKYASDKEWIQDKVAWALYHTWKEADDRKTENSSEIPNNCDTCGTPRHLCEYCIEEDRMWTPKAEPRTSGVVWTEDAIKNEPKPYITWASTDEPRTDCPFGEDDKCFGCGDNTKCVVFDEPQTERSE